MKVWLAITDVYEQRGVSGVFSTAELAMADHPIRPSKYHPEARWVERDDGSWNNGCDNGDACEIVPYKVDDPEWGLPDGTP